MQPSNPMRLNVLLPAEKILFFSDKDDKDKILQQLVRVAHPLLPSQEVVSLAAQISKREDTISTVLPTGIAFPHARVEGLENLTAALALFSHPVLFSGEKKVRALLLFLSPADPAFFSQHLQFLSICAQTFTTEFVRQLTTCRNAQEAALLFK